MIPIWVKETAKAAVASTMAGIAVAITALADGHITATEWLLIAGTVLSTWIATWAVPNATPTYEINKRS